ncbi:putative major facilitator superfamily transporter [Acidiphilium multivorum AIU301]|uniref:Putative major facilitator superfamily transporter n=1 Tax=Acidiphilium multivorum (strain DSM 11245 / JCM 8867 / NBRC 100883 / AIU 301) TaxID=926570 RepID=F0IX87_ACIMA|nr:MULTISPECIES: MFS transporter [Acidiphilium]BAJ80497.1 putative major facilitator superfamily transporter [Acidiphilium multivorum AIU301]GAN72893.1 major facilitator superfamily transporter [Acidiphilium multivorum AIU301]
MATARPDIVRLMGARGARSIAQGALVVDFALYVTKLGWSAAFLGVVFALSILFAVAVTTLVGPASDRFGRKRFVLVYEAISVLAALIGLLTQATLPLAFAAVIGGFGRGANGSAGPFAPAEQSWLSGLIEKREFGTVLSINTAIGFFGMGIGAVLAGLIGASRPMFVLPLAASLIATMLLALTPDPPREAAARTEGHEAVSKAENSLLWKLAGLNILNGTGIGLSGPFISWWFAARYHAGASAIGPALAIAFAAAGIAALTTGRLTRRLGTVRAVVLMRGIGLVSLFALPFSPSFGVALVVYALRSAFNRGTAGARQAVALGLVRGERRGLAASVNTISVLLPRGIAPALAGVLFESGALAAPFLLAGLFQGAYLFIYPRVFGRHDPSRSA